jgi:hypothetical protein
MLVGSAVGQLAGVASSVHTRIRPDIAIALVVGIPSVIGMFVILFSGRRWVTLLGVLVAVQVVNSG